MRHIVSTILLSNDRGNEISQEPLSHVAAVISEGDVVRQPPITMLLSYSCHNLILELETVPLGSPLPSKSVIDVC